MVGEGAAVLVRRALTAAGARPGHAARPRPFPRALRRAPARHDVPLSRHARRARRARSARRRWPCSPTSRLPRPSACSTALGVRQLLHRGGGRRRPVAAQARSGRARRPARARRAAGRWCWSAIRRSMPRPPARAGAAFVLARYGFGAAAFAGRQSCDAVRRRRRPPDAARDVIREALPGSSIAAPPIVIARVYADRRRAASRRRGRRS